MTYINATEFAGGLYVAEIRASIGIRFLQPVTADVPAL